MKLEEFKSGSLKKQYQYSSFCPSKINQEWIWNDPSINILLEKAVKYLSELNAFSVMVPDVNLFIEMHIAKEASTSSKIEGTQTEIHDAVMDQENIIPEKRDDWQEVQNYIQAMNFAIKELENIPLSNRLLKEAHSILMQGVRGEKKSPGEFRISQNWIGGTSLIDAVFIPPHHEEVPELMSDLELFWHNEQINVPHLIRIAISHYQFETIHPFLDGNGRIGRLLITLYLVSLGFMRKPCLYLSDYLEKHRASYYDALTTVRNSNNLIHWVKFFLKAICDTSEKGIKTFEAILALKKQVEKDIYEKGSAFSKNALRVVEFLYKKPIVTSANVSKELKLTLKTALKTLTKLESMGILKEVTGFKRNRLYVFETYIDLFTK